MAKFLIYLEQFLIRNIRTDESNIHFRNHDVLSHRITEINHVCDHLTLFAFNNTLLVADIQDRTKLALCNRRRVIRLYMEQMH